MGKRGLVRSIAVVALLATGTQAAYVVQPGDTLSHIARRVGTTVGELVSLNGLADADHIRAGDRLELPVASAPAPPSAAAPARAGTSGATTYTVQRGDALSRIAARHGVTLAAIEAANDIDDPNRIHVGQVLTIPTSGPEVVAAATGPTRPAPVPADRAEVGRLIEEVAREYGWSPAFVKALAWQESGWQMTKVSSTGARGVMQVMPGTGEFVGRRLVGRTLDLDDPRDNITAGVAFLDYLYSLTGGDAEMTLAGYYQGLASVRRNGMYEDTVRYIANVLALRARFV